MQVVLSLNRLWPICLVPWRKTQQLMLVGTGFYFNIPITGGSASTHGLGPVLPRDPALPVLPIRLLAKIIPESPSFSHLKPTVQIPIHLGSESPSSRSSSLFQDLGNGVISLHIVVQKSVCHVTLDHGETQERHRS